jgi:hypothetical protein
MSGVYPRCDAFTDDAAEFALGLLGGEARAGAITHLDGCSRCRALVESLSEAGDSLLAAVPGAEPAAGFEGRVLERLELANVSRPPHPAKGRRPRRRWTAAAGWVLAAAACLVALVGYVVAGPSSPALAEATMRTPSGHAVGDVYVHSGDESWLLVSVPGWTPAATQGDRQYDLRIVDADGHATTYPGLSLTWGKGAWGTTLPADASVASVALLGDDGTVWCSATLDA